MSLTRKQIDEILSDYKFEKKRQKGSHEWFERDGMGVTVATKGEFFKKNSNFYDKKD